MKKNTFLSSLLVAIVFQSNAHVNLINPIGGEMLSPGEIVTIKWQETIRHNTMNWDLFFSNDGGMTWEPIAEDIALEEDSYDWMVSETLTNQGRIKVVQDNMVTDYEGISNDFSIGDASIPPVTGLKATSGENEIKIYPNPTSDLATIEFDNPRQENHTLIIYNLQGKLVKTISDITASRAIIGREHLIGGIYFFQLYSHHEIRTSGRLVIK